MWHKLLLSLNIETVTFHYVNFNYYTVSDDNDNKIIWSYTKVATIFIKFKYLAKTL